MKILLRRNSLLTLILLFLVLFSVVSCQNRTAPAEKGVETDSPRSTDAPTPERPTLNKKNSTYDGPAVDPDRAGIGGGATALSYSVYSALMIVLFALSFSW